MFAVDVATYSDATILHKVAATSHAEAIVSFTVDVITFVVALVAQKEAPTDWIVAAVRVGAVMSCTKAASSYIAAEAGLMADEIVHIAPARSYAVAAITRMRHFDPVENSPEKRRILFF